MTSVLESFPLSPPSPGRDVADDLLGAFAAAACSVKAIGVDVPTPERGADTRSSSSGSHAAGSTPLTAPQTAPITAPTTAGVPADVVARQSARGRFSRWKHRFAVKGAVPLHRAFGKRVDHAFGILMYHRVTPVVPGLPEPTYNVAPDRFRAQLAGLLAQGFIAWPLRMALEAAQGGRPIPREVFVVTFDDGYENVYQHAWPVLRDLGVPATLFVSTAYLDSPDPFPFDDWAGKGSPATEPESWRPLTTAQCREMQASGLIELASHTHTHADFRGRPEELVQDLKSSLALLRDRFQVTDSTFAFPYGTRSDGFSGPALAEACRAAGLLCGLTTEEELVRHGDDPFDWGRFTAESDDTAETLAAKLSGWFNLLRGAWRRLHKPLSSGDLRKSRPPVTASTLPGRNR